MLHMNGLVAISICEFGKGRLFGETAGFARAVCMQSHVVCTRTLALRDKGVSALTYTVDPLP
jgi:hypothetical protein